MDKVEYFQSIYEAQFALGKKTGACLSAQYLALEAFLQRSNDWHFHWWPIVGISAAAWKLLQHRAAGTHRNRLLSTRGIIRAHLYDRVERGRAQRPVRAAIRLNSPPSATPDGSTLSAWHARSR